MTRIAPYLALTLLAFTGCTPDSVREVSAETLSSTLRSDSDMRPASGPQQAYELRRVWSGSAFNFYWNEPSPDGRYVSEIHWGSGNLAVTNLLNGEMEQVTHETNYEGFAWGSVFSPDGTQLAYRWGLGEAGFELRTVGVDGSDPRVLVGIRPDVATILPTDWSADGRHILAAVERPDNTVQLTLISVADGSMQVLKSLGWHWPEEAVLSHDGRYVAYSLRQASSSADADPPELQILAVDGSQEVTVAPHERPQRMLGWTPDGGAVLFHRSEGTSGSIWMVAIQAGRQAGEPILLAPDVRVSSIGFSEEAYFFGTPVESEQVHTATIDPSGGGFVTDPRPVGDPSAPPTRSGAWSVDGDQLAYVRRGKAGYTLVVRAVDGGEERAIELSTMQFVQDVVWAPDGESVLVMGAARARQDVGVAIYRIDLTSGEPTFLVRGAYEAGGFAVSRDGRSLYIARQQQGIVRFDLSTREETLVYADPSSLHALIAVSPDGATVAFTAAATTSGTDAVVHGSLLVVMPTDGRGVAREVYRAQAPERLGRRTGLSWTPDGRALLFQRFEGYTPASDETECSGAKVCRFLTRIAIDGGTPQDLVQLDCDITASGCLPLLLRVHPDGRRIAFNWGNPKGEIWMMTGFGVGDVASGESGGR